MIKVLLNTGLILLFITIFAGCMAGPSTTTAYTSTPVSSSTSVSATPPPTTTTQVTKPTTTTITPTAAYTVNVSTSSTLGQYMVDGKGMTLYWNNKDAPGVSNVSAALLANWPQFYAANVVVPSSLNASDFGSITTGGSPQTTYKQYPLYYFIRDTAPGDTLGQGLLDEWFVVNPSASAPPASTTTTTSSTTTSATSTTSSTTTTVSSTTAPSTAPAISIIYPVEGTYHIVYNEVITVSVSNFKLVDKTGQTNVPREGHIIYYADVPIPTTPGQPALTAQGTYAVSSNTSYVWTTLFAGKHTLGVQLVNNDNTPLSPPVTAQVTINVNT